MEEYQANLFRPMYREKEVFYHECEECENGIHLYEKYYTVPSGVFGLDQEQEVGHTRMSLFGICQVLILA